MIFVTVGVQLPFDRLISTIDEWAGRTTGLDVLAQTGRSRYRPRHIRAEPTMTSSQFREAIDKAELVIAHAGMGSIITALERGRPIIVMPRQASLGEHRNDHQLATAHYMSTRKLVTVAKDEANLVELLESRASLPAGSRIQPTADPALLDRIRSFVA